MKTYRNGKYIEMTPEEIATMQEEQAKADAAEKHRTLTESEVSRMLITAQINTLTVDDAMALRMADYYPVFAPDMVVKVGDRLTWGGKLYRVIYEHTTQGTWTPDTSPSLFVRIDETHDGSEFDPIPYEGNMVLEKGKYYTQDGVTYVCTRDTVTAVYHALGELVGMYVEVVTT